MYSVQKPNISLSYTPSSESYSNCYFCSFIIPLIDRQATEQCTQIHHIQLPDTESGRRLNSLNLGQDSSNPDFGLCGFFWSLWQNLQYYITFCILSNSFLSSYQSELLTTAPGEFILTHCGWSGTQEGFTISFLSSPLANYHSILTPYSSVTAPEVCDSCDQSTFHGSLSSGFKLSDVAFGWLE
jgi:hypothetical protein